MRSKTRVEILKFFGYSGKGGSYLTLKKRIKHLNIDTSHLGTSQDHIKELGRKREIPLEDILVENSTYSRTHLKKKLIKLKLLEEVCVICGLENKWKGKKLVLILDHINGINNDHRLENLRLVCPNCNSQLPTHCGKHLRKTKKKHYCKCGNEKFRTSKICSKCRSKNNRKVKDRPSLEQLLKDIKELKYVGTGKKYGVSDNTIRNWVSDYKA